MTTVASKVLDTELAVFARNHARHLEEAAAASARDAESLRTFRSHRRWVTPARVVPLHGSVPIYFAVVDGGPIVEYQGELVEVHVDPSVNDSKTQGLLRYCGETTRSEGVWNDDVGTLYLVRGCRKIRNPFPQSELIKFDGGAPLDAGYTRAYACVRRRRRRIAELGLRTNAESH